MTTTTTTTTAAAAAGPVLQVTGVRKAFGTAAGHATVLDGVDLTVSRGEIVAIAGRSGSGKTVLLTVVAGWERPDAGTVERPRSTPDHPDHPERPGPAPAEARRPGTRSRTRTPAGDDQPPWRELAVVPQSLGLLDELTVAENIALPRRLDPSRRPEDVPELAERLGIDHLADRFPNQISLGERQRVALARAAALSPRLLIADEPIAHQNEAFAQVVLTVIADLAARGTGCLLATHDELAFQAAHRVLHLVDGRITAPPAPSVLR